MKKLALIIILFPLIVGCSNKENNNLNTNVNKNEKEEILQENENEVEDKIEEDKIEIGMYLYNNKTRTLLDNYKTQFILNQDLLSVEVYNVEKEELEVGSQKELWNKYYEQYKDINPKVAYHIKFSTVDSGIIDKTIYSPKDTEQIYDYMQIYLYDDINQLDNTTYTHITEEEISDDTILTSIKLTGSTKTDSINSDIELSAFMYTDKSVDIDDTNNKYKIIISRK